MYFTSTIIVDFMLIILAVPEQDHPRPHWHLIFFAVKGLLIRFYSKNLCNLILTIASPMPRSLLIGNHLLKWDYEDSNKEE